jgi:hypothetical protein
MMDNTLLFNKLSGLPEHLKSEVADFIDFLMSRSKPDKGKTPAPHPTFGSAKGLLKMKKGFDEPLEDFKEYIS